jgi:hypothetical protein
VSPRDLIRFEEEPEEVALTAVTAAAGSNSITGRITRCGRPAAGVSVQATGILTLGIKTDVKPCLLGTTTRSLGSATTAANGTYSITYTPSLPNVGFCAYSARVRVTLFDGGVAVGQSTEQLERPSIRIDRELYPDCSGGRSVVMVIDGTGRAVADAEVFHNGRLAGRTNGQGIVSVASLAVGNRLVARQLLNERRTDRDGHAEGSTAGWSHRTYSTSLRVRHDANGDNVELRQFVVADPAALQRLQVSSLNTLIGLNLVVSIEWDATDTEIRRYLDRLFEMSELLYNATDGQLLVERLAVLDNRRLWDDADIRIYANANQHSQADVGDLLSGGGRIHMNPNDAHEPSVFLHELGHYAFNVYDEYKPGPGWEESDGPHICTFASVEEGTDFSEGGSKDSCLMRGARDSEIKKICSTHPSNPHTHTTRQGLKDCWSEILTQFADPRWRLHSPAGRGAIVDVFPDSGVPLGTSTAPFPEVGGVASYIPIERWKPILHTSSIVRDGECPARLVRVESDGEPLNGVRVSLESGTVTTFQGVTKEYHHHGEFTTGPGEIRLRGAHVGDKVTAFVTPPGGGILYGSAQVDDCGPAALVISLRRFSIPFVQRLDPLGAAELRVHVEPTRGAPRQAIVRVRVGGMEPIPIAVPAVSPAEGGVRGRLVGLPEHGVTDVEIAVVDDDGREVAVRTASSFASLREHDPLEMFSADGRLELTLPAGSLDAPAGLVIETAVGVPGPPAGTHVVGDAYRVTSSRGDRLAFDALLDINFDRDDASDQQAAAIVRLGGDPPAWHEVPDQRRGDGVVTAWIDRLGIYALRQPT